jgi:hypothetical protein
VLEQGHQYVDGGFRRGSHGETHDVVTPATGEVVARTDLATPDDVHAAVTAARAQARWGRATRGERGTDMSRCSVDEHTQVTHVSFDITGAPRKDRHPTIFGDR